MTGPWHTAGTATGHAGGGEKTGHEGVPRAEGRGPRAPVREPHRDEAVGLRQRADEVQSAELDFVRVVEEERTEGEGAVDEAAVLVHKPNALLWVQACPPTPCTHTRVSANAAREACGGPCWCRVACGRLCAHQHLVQAPCDEAVGAAGGLADLAGERNDVRRDEVQRRLRLCMHGAGACAGARVSAGGRRRGRGRGRTSRLSRYGSNVGCRSVLLRLSALRPSAATSACATKSNTNTDTAVRSACVAVCACVRRAVPCA